MDAVPDESLPGDADGLRTYLTRVYQRLLAGSESGGSEALDPDSPTDPEEWLYDTLGSLLTMPVASRTRQAAFKVVAGVPGVRSGGSGRDPLGRKGEVVARSIKVDGGGTAEQQFVIDRKTGLLLARQKAVVKPGPSHLWARPGTVVQFDAYTLRWTDRNPRL